MSSETVQPDSDPHRPRALSFNRYRDIVRQDWAAALDANSEVEVQRCLERHPSLLPFDRGGSAGGHHGPWMRVVITQPQLTGLHSFVPDFMWFERDSSTVTAVCVEVESPAKFWFRKDGVQTAALTQALDQIQEWRGWFQTVNTKELFSQYALPYEFLFRVFKQRFVLLYGRRSEFDAAAGSRHGLSAARLNRKRASIAPPDVTVRTLDSLDPDGSDARVTTITYRDHLLQAVTIPPTWTTGQWVRDFVRSVEGIEEAIGRMEHAPAQRVEYLKSRVRFWKSVSATAAGGTEEE